MWTPPHFWALALYKCEDYQKAGIPMLPAVAGRQTTIHHIVVYTFLLGLTSLLPYFLGMGGVVYLVTALVVSGLFMKYAIGLYRDSDNKVARAMFRFSLSYLFLLFTALIIDKGIF